MKEAVVSRCRAWSSLVLVTILIGSALLGACGEDKARKPPPSVVITLQAEPLATVETGCVTADLESWYEVASTLIATFVSVSKDAVNHDPADMPGIINRLTDLRDAIASRPTPECALSTHNAIMLNARTILLGLQRYGNGDITQQELRTQIDSATQEIETGVTSMLAGLQSGLEQQLAQARTPQALQPQTPPPTSGP
jgi:hypothetical protein